ncbi:unnamed protein product [Hermetia illucens]|uniref:Uncharacterized protein n=1 Tax=Hermetia illucens TaxID=343691 RepID=A0A7R8UPN8_HERIL|nr:uncharacterized protein LOC119652554 [Hermetia illucens]XP_037912690.1 uncharacterized protein LOC119652554 [Hermetia illucens]XP_037912693.1 uncharacterized protein LOC119652554 [Hermetia illucens]XP_037912694.1 uncharacterized protein LOC119652554 [Hermetia illucens]CAD7084711.1 unnamed protein product [Hermetia illucens]
MTGPVVIPLEAEENNNEKVINQDKKNIVEIKKPKPYTLRRKVKSRSRPPACFDFCGCYCFLILCIIIFILVGVLFYDYVYSHTRHEVSTTEIIACCKSLLKLRNCGD